MVYLDNAATTYPKPPSVISKSSFAMINYGANPGRSGHILSMKTGEAVFAARQRCAEFFGSEVENVCFVLNCTQAINTVLKGFLTHNVHVIVSDIEHNAVMRPLNSLVKTIGISYSIAETDDDDDITVRNFEKLINQKTRLIICTAASNVTGKILPYKKIGDLCKKRGICFTLDAAQGGGILPITLSDNINFICAAGHKGLYGPMGTGLLVTDGRYKLKTLIEGGTGSASMDINQPEFLPDRFESGTINTSGAIALGAGVTFVADKGIETVYEHEWSLCKFAFDNLDKNPKVLLYQKEYTKKSVPLFCFNLSGLSSDEASKNLSDNGFFLRGGFHCAPAAHKKMGTLEKGAVRFAPSVFTTKSEVASFIRAVYKITQ